MLTFVLMTILAAPPAPLGANPAAAPREGYEAEVPLKPVQPSDPHRRRAVFAEKVKTAWVLAGDGRLRSEAEACP
jgi:hypothetical protein